ncbi:hypothetical protein [Domibacillus robiginosus]|uniref:hypothetical protein n=1 Tax=Domibacillus robiginosus TaxID=1071054 RepID=UPI00067C31B1|nr:hypothetical protein [Domibacillus robiginosus]
MLKMLLGTLLMIFLILAIGSVVLEEFPGAQPLWEEGKVHAVSLYNSSLGKFGMTGTLLLIIAICFLAGTSKHY